MPETGSICDGDRFAESISRLHRRQGGKMDWLPSPRQSAPKAKLACGAAY